MMNTIDTSSFFFTLTSRAIFTGLISVRSVDRVDGSTRMYVTLKGGPKKRLLIKKNELHRSHEPTDDRIVLTDRLFR